MQSKQIFNGRFSGKGRKFPAFLYVCFMRKTLLLVGWAVVFFQANVWSQSVSELVVSALGRNDISSLVRHFHSIVDIQIPGTVGDFSDTQAMMVLRNFFSLHPVKSVKITKEGTLSDGSIYALGELLSGSRKYRLYFVLRETGGTRKVHVFQLTETDGPG
jgi:hypothetical protein